VLVVRPFVNTAAILLLIGMGSAQTSADHAKGPGVKIGETIPAFSLPDQNGKQQSLASLRGPKGLMLVFFRSADW
jgi:cytochrome oxidase Cu insertion factor (SCO1/SenC/PrrC family)